MDYFERPDLLRPPIMRAAYSDRTAWLMAECSRLAYEKDDAKFRQGLKDGGFELVEAIEEKGFRAFVAKREDLAVLAFRGTEFDNPREIVADLDCRLVNAPAGEVHNGFLNAYGEIAKRVLETVEAKVGDFPLYVTGHSLGAALATIAAYYLERDSLAACYTFGSPRVGKEELDDNIKCPIYRVVNDKDAVTMVPPRWSHYYFHVGDERLLTRDGRLIRSSDRFAFLKLEAFFKTIITKVIFWRDYMGDHAIAQYVEKLEKIAVLRNKAPMEERKK